MRSARELDGGDIVLGHFTLGRTFPLRERLAAARDAGVAGVGLFLVDLELHAAEGLDDDELERLLREHEMLLVDLDLIVLAPSDAAQRERSARFVRRAAELADRFGFRYLQTIGPTAGDGAAGFDQTVDALGEVADAMAPYGVEVGLEYVGFTTVATADEAVAAVTACGRANVGVCVDIWHHRRASDMVDLTTIPASLVRCVQMNDGPRVPEHPDYKVDCVRNRWAPGTGEMDAVGFAASLMAMGVDAPWTLEVCRDAAELTDGRGYAHVQRSVAALRDVLERARLGMVS
jgi:sugar phosphate isomerase/epimerase